MPPWLIAILGAAAVGGTIYYVAKPSTAAAGAKPAGTPSTGTTTGPGSEVVLAGLTSALQAAAANYTANSLPPNSAASPNVGPTAKGPTKAQLAWLQVINSTYITDALAQQVGGTFATADWLKAAIANQILIGVTYPPLAKPLGAYALALDV